MKLYINRKPKEIDKKKLTNLVEKILSEFDKSDKELEITYIDNEAIKDMNLQYLNKDDYTDVISFPLEDDEDDFLGDIYISHEQAKIQAADFDTDYIHELMRLTIHGILHILGYEDDTPEKKEIIHKEEDRWMRVYFGEKMNDDNK